MQPILRCGSAHPPQAIFLQIQDKEVPQNNHLCYTRAVTDRQILGLNGAFRSLNGPQRHPIGSDGLALSGSVTLSLSLFSQLRLGGKLPVHQR